MKADTVGSDNIESRIKQLESLQAQQSEELRLSFHELGDRLSPSNVMKNALNSVISSPGLRSTVLDTAISAGAGFLGRKLIVRRSGNIFLKVAGVAVQFLLSNFIRNKIPDIKESIATGKNGVEH